MGARIRGWLARCLAVLVAPAALAGVMAAVAPASSASPLSHRPAANPWPAAAAGSASLQAAVGKSLGTPASANGYSQTAELTGSGGLGFSVALSANGRTALIGAPDQNSIAGAVYVYTLRDGTWSQTAELTASDAAADDDFGWSVALSANGRTALIGAPGHDTYAGAAYVFTLRHRTWSQTAELTASHPAAHDFFGHSVALSGRGRTALVGAPFQNSVAGAVYMFTLQGGTWSQTAELTAPHAASSDLFGWSVALSGRGRTALVGAPGRNSGAGAVYVFTLQGGTWSQTAELTAPHAANDAFGHSVALSARGRTALVGAPGHNSGAGVGYVFTLRHGTWSQTAELSASHATPDSEAGGSAALSASGRTALLGADAYDSGAGAAYVFRLSHGSWSQVATLTPSDVASDNQFGISAALSAWGRTALVGAFGHDLGAGAAYVFTRGGA
jgi:hypothetical protein